MENEDIRIWGIYNTFGNPEALEQLDEIDIWKKIDNLGIAYFGQYMIAINLGHKKYLNKI